MAFVREIYPQGYFLEDCYWIPTKYNFPSEPWTPGEGLMRSTNLALKNSYNCLASMYIAMRRRGIMDANDLSTYGVSHYEHKDIMSAINGEQGILSMHRQIIAMGGVPMPIPCEIVNVLKDCLKPNVYEEVWSKPFEWLKPASHVLECRQFDNFHLIDEQIQLPSGLSASKNLYLLDHYHEMAKLYNRVLSRRFREHLLPASYSCKTKELAEILKKMREIAVELIQEICNDGDAPFLVPGVFDMDKLVVLSLFEDTPRTRTVCLS